MRPTENWLIRIDDEVASLNDKHDKSDYFSSKLSRLGDT